MEDNSFCTNCRKKSYCKKICPELEEHLKTLETPQQELTLTDIGINDNNIRQSVWDTTNYYDLISRAQKKHKFSQKIFDMLYDYYCAGDRIDIIAPKFNLSSQYVYFILNKYIIK